MIYFLDPAEKGFADSWFFKLIVMCSMMLAWGQVLSLPLDVANSHGGVGNLQIDILWQILYLSIFCFVTVILPTAMFFFESDDEEPVCDRIWYTAKHLFFVVAVEGLVLGLMYGLIANTSIPIEVYTCDWEEANNSPSPGEVQKTNCSSSSEVLVIPVTFPIYVMALMSFVGWFLLALFGGIGLGAIPLDLINKFRFRPQRLTKVEIDAKERLLRERAKDLIEIASQIKVSRGEIGTESSWLSRRKLKNTLRRDVNRLQAETLLLEQDYEIFLQEKDESKKSPLWYPVYLFIGVLSLVVSILWLLQILLYILINTNGVSATPFLNDILTGLETPGTSFLATIIYCTLTMYLMLAVIKGNVKFGLRFFCFCKSHPIKKDNTPMNSMLFNSMLVLLTSVAVTLFCTNALGKYTRLTAINNMFAIQVRHLEFFRYFYDNNVFEYMLFIWAILSAIYLMCKNKDSPAAKFTKFDMEFEKEKMKYFNKAS
jgi:LMBR1 domain-containing protein 1